jgi:hypothetical protein
MSFCDATTDWGKGMMLDIESLKSRGVCLWAYARSQPVLESMIREAELIIDGLDVIQEKAIQVKAAREKVLQWDWEMRSRLCLLYRPAEPVLEAFRSFPLVINRDQSLRHQIQSMSDGVAIRLECLRLLLRRMDEFSVARLRNSRRRGTRAAQPAGRLTNERMS